MLCVRCHVGLSFSSLPVCVPRRSMCKVSWKALKQRLIDHMGDRNAIFSSPRLRLNEAVFTADDLFWSHRIFVPRALLYPLRISSERRAKNEQRKVTFFEVPEMESSFEGFDWFTLCNSFSHPLDGSLSPSHPTSIVDCVLEPVNLYIYISRARGN